MKSWRVGGALWALTLAWGAGAGGGPLRAQVPATTRADAPDRAATGRLNAAARLGARLERLLADPALARAHVGLVVQVAETGEVLFRREAERRFVPASNTKLVTAAVGLHELGAAYRWRTRLLAEGALRNGTLEGDLWVVGSGDPSVTRIELGRWAAAVAAAGIRRIAGDVVGDDRAFDGPQWSAGWMWDDLYTGWSAGVSGLQLWPNAVRARLVPGDSVGAAAVLRTPEDEPALPISVRVRTGAPESEVRLRWIPSPEGGPVALDGWIPAGADSVRLSLAPRHPTPFLLWHLGRALADAGIRIGGHLRRARPGEIAAADPSWETEFVSDSLGGILSQLLKPSDNQIAESLLRTLGREKGRTGSAREGLRVIQSTLSEWGIAPGAISLTDGSGLSRYNQVTPNAVSRLLRTMWRQPEFATFADALPIAGVDGTLEARMLGMPAAGNVRAKTGSLSSVRALSGYLTDGDGETLIFSLLLNGYEAPGDVATALEDLLIEQLSLYHRKTEPGWPDFRRAEPR